MTLSWLCLIQLSLMLTFNFNLGLVYAPRRIKPLKENSQDSGFHISCFRGLKLNFGSVRKRFIKVFKLVVSFFKFSAVSFLLSTILHSGSVSFCVLNYFSAAYEAGNPHRVIERVSQSRFRKNECFCCRKDGDRVQLQIQNVNMLNVCPGDQGLNMHEERPLLFISTLYIGNT